MRSRVQVGVVCWKGEEAFFDRSEGFKVARMTVQSIAVILMSWCTAPERVVEVVT